jgi:hypothetical protein
MSNQLVVICYSSLNELIKDTISHWDYQKIFLVDFCFSLFQQSSKNDFA